jgi:hypothetical protein
MNQKIINLVVITNLLTEFISKVGDVTLLRSRLMEIQHWNTALETTVTLCSYFIISRKEWK